MRTQNSQAKRVSAGFGYSHVMVGNTKVYTTKIRTKQFDLLRYAIEQYKRNENKLQGTYGLIKLNKNRQNYVTYEFVTTDLKAMNQFRREMDQARAEVLDVQALRRCTRDIRCGRGQISKRADTRDTRDDGVCSDQVRAVVRDTDRNVGRSQRAIRILNSDSTNDDAAAVSGSATIGQTTTQNWDGNSRITGGVQRSRTDDADAKVAE